jgi:hypothetical protein
MDRPVYVNPAGLVARAVTRRSPKGGGTDEEDFGGTCHGTGGGSGAGEFVAGLAVAHPGHGRCVSAAWFGHGRVSGLVRGSLSVEGVLVRGDNAGRLLARQRLDRGCGPAHLDVRVGLLLAAVPVAVRRAGDRRGAGAPGQADHWRGAHGSVSDHARPDGGSRGGRAGRLGPPPAAAALGRDRDPWLDPRPDVGFRDRRGIHRRPRLVQSGRSARCALFPAAAVVVHARRAGRVLPVAQLVGAGDDHAAGNGYRRHELAGAPLSWLRLSRPRHCCMQGSFTSARILGGSCISAPTCRCWWGQSRCWRGTAEGRASWPARKTGSRRRRSGGQ